LFFEWTKSMDKRNKTSGGLDFAPPMLALRDASPNPLGRKVLWTIIILIASLVVWALIGRLDIVAVAEGKLVPQSYLKIVQPPEAGIVKEIMVKEGETVTAGQTLMRMDAIVTEADGRAMDAEHARKSLALRRIDAELGGQVFRTLANDPPALAMEVAAQYQANRSAYDAALAEEQSRLIKAKQDMYAAEQVLTKLADTIPHYQQQAQAFDKLEEKGFVGPLMASDKRREKIEKEQEFKTQQHVIESARAGILQSEKRLTQIQSDYRRQLYAERNEVANALEKLTQEIAKQSHRRELLELRAPQTSIVKDLATHTIGTVVQPGTVLLTLVPKEDILRAEVWVSNEDIGFVREGQTVKLKFAAFPFQKYGLAEGTVEHVSADAADTPAASGTPAEGNKNTPMPLGYKALVALKTVRLEANGRACPLSAGMQTNAEILLGTRTVAEYLLSPVKKAWHEAGRER
jgi:hemolysin D